jgi:hypothetical protein
MIRNKIVPRFVVLIACLIVIIGITATRATIGRGAGLVVWMALLVIILIILIDLWRSALAEKGVWRILKIIGVSVLSSSLIVPLLIFGLKLFQA